MVSQPVRTRDGCDVFEQQLMAGAGTVACGAHEASRFSALQLVRPSSRTASSRRDWILEAMTWVPDFQSTWQILLQCARPRCHPKSVHRMPSTMMTACGREWVSFWVDSRGRRIDSMALGITADAARRPQVEVCFADTCSVSGLRGRRTSNDS